MTWLEFTASVISAIAWPVVVLIAVFAFREPLTGLVPLLQRLKYKDFELEFEKKLAEARADAEIPAVAPPVPELAAEQLRIHELAHISPRAAVAEAWRWIEQASLDSSRPVVADATVPEARHGTLTPDERTYFRAISLIRDMKSLRNDAVHSPEFAMSPDAALDYAETARQVVEYLRSIPKD